MSRVRQWLAASMLMAVFASSPVAAGTPVCGDASDQDLDCDGVVRLPVPASLALVGAGVGLLALLKRRR